MSPWAHFVTSYLARLAPALFLVPVFAIVITRRSQRKRTFHPDGNTRAPQNKTAWPSFGPIAETEEADAWRLSPAIAHTMQAIHKRLAIRAK
jgi:hypothetical protein